MNDNIIGLTISELCLLLLFIVLTILFLNNSAYEKSIHKSSTEIENKDSQIQEKNELISLLEEQRLADQSIIKKKKNEISLLNEDIKLSQQKILDLEQKIFGNSTTIEEFYKQKEKILRLKNELKISKHEIEEIIAKEKLQSAMKPSCIEKGVKDSFLCSIEIIGSNEFIIDNKPYTYSQLLEYFEGDLKEAEINSCVLSVKVKASPTISASGYDKGLRKIERIFYVQRLRIN